jgi:hypothetical protein
MLFIEFETELFFNENLIKYRNVDNEDWYYMFLDIETLNLLLNNFGIISTIRIPTRKTCADNPSTGKEIKIKYCGANIKLYCKNNTPFYLPHIEQNY